MGHHIMDWGRRLGAQPGRQRLVHRASLNTGNRAGIAQQLNCPWAAKRGGSVASAVRIDTKDGGRKGDRRAAAYNGGRG